MEGTELNTTTISAKKLLKAHWLVKCRPDLATEDDHTLVKSALWSDIQRAYALVAMACVVNNRSSDFSTVLMAATIQT